MSRFFRLSFALVLATVSLAACYSNPTGLESRYACGSANLPGESGCQSGIDNQVDP